MENINLWTIEKESSKKFNWLENLSPTSIGY